MILRGRKREEWIQRLAFGRAYWEREFETSDFYAEARERGAGIEAFDRAYIVRQIATHFEATTGKRECPFVVSEAFVKACQRRVKRARRDIDEFDPLPSYLTGEEVN